MAQILQYLAFALASKLIQLESEKLREQFSADALHHLLAHLNVREGQRVDVRSWRVCWELLRQRVIAGVIVRERKRIVIEIVHHFEAFKQAYQV